MKDFKLDLDGDIVIDKGNISLASDNDLIEQKVRQILRTNLGEWKYDEDEGIDIYSILTKNPNEELIEDNIKSGLMQVDDTFRITAFECIESGDRQMTIRFSAVNSSNEEINMEL